MSDLTTPWGRLKDTATFLQLVASQGGPLSGNAMEHARRLLVELALLKAERPEGGESKDAERYRKVRGMLMSYCLARWFERLPNLPVTTDGFDACIDEAPDMNSDRLTNNGATRKVDGGTEHG